MQEKAANSEKSTVADLTLDDIDRAVMREEQHAAELDYLAQRKHAQGKSDWASDYEGLARGHRETAADLRRIKSELVKRLAEIRAI